MSPLWEGEYLIGWWELSQLPLSMLRLHQEWTRVTCGSKTSLWKQFPKLKSVQMHHTGQWEHLSLALKRNKQNSTKQHGRNNYAATFQGYEKFWIWRGVMIKNIQGCSRNTCQQPLQKNYGFLGALWAWLLFCRCFSTQLGDIIRAWKEVCPLFIY